MLLDNARSGKKFTGQTPWLKIWLKKKNVEKSKNKQVPLATKVDEVCGEKEITEMWTDHYQALLNSVTHRRLPQKLGDE